MTVHYDIIYAIQYIYKSDETRVLFATHVGLPFPPLPTVASPLTQLTMHAEAEPMNCI